MSLDTEEAHTEAPQTPPEKISPLALSLGGLVLVGITLYLLSWSAPVVTPIFFALYLTAILSPIYVWLSRKGLNKALILLLLIGGILGAGAAIAWLALVSVQGLQDSLTSYDNLLTERVTAVVDTISNDPELAEEVSRILSSLLVNVLLITLNVAGNFLFAAVLTAFLLLEFDRFMGLAQTSLKDRALFGVLPNMVDTAVRYIGIRTRLNLITGIGVTILCVLLRVDYPLLWGVWAFMLSYIPYIGLLTAMIPPSLLAWAESGPLHALIMVVGITVMNLAIENILEPSYTGKKLQLSPAIVFISFFFWAWLLGPVGALLSMPITVFILLISRNHAETQWLAQLIGRTEPEGVNTS